MTADIDDIVALNDWYAVAVENDVVPERPRVTRLLGRQIKVWKDREGTFSAAEQTPDAPERSLPVEIKHHYLWTTLGTPAAPIFDIPEASDPGRRFVPCGRVTVRGSGLRIVENFLDMAHFPFVHADILGSEPHTEVKPYNAKISGTADEVWATECVFHQPKAALAASGAVEVEYSFRVPSPFNAILHKASPNRKEALDLVGLLVQPRSETLCDAFPFYMLFDDQNPDAAIAEFEQMIFLQDKSIIENQIPLGLPLGAGAEIPTRADAISIAYRRWLKAKGLKYGTARPGARA